jgi:hypothetical protein
LELNYRGLPCIYRIIFVGLNAFLDDNPMKPNPNYKNTLAVSILLAFSLTGFSSCGWMHNLFGPKYGCPSDGKNVGAERILSGEKVPKAGKFKS